MSNPPLKLKLKIGPPTGVAAPSPSTPVAATPGGSKPQFKFKSNSVVSTPAASQETPKPKKSKAGRATKPSAKVIESRKRIKDEDDSENEGSTIAVQPPPKKVKLHLNGPKTPITPVPPTPSVNIKAKVKGKPPKRPLGDGYDSEASDREIDPTIEEEFILRMMPGEDCDYLRQAITEKRIGIPKKEGGPDIHFRFFDNDGRRAAITIKGNMYAATLVDLPCIIEGMKSWDRRGWWKSADICQMLLVFAPVQNELDVKNIALPSIIDPLTHQYPHGITPPMHYARKRRFRKRLHRTQIEAVEDEVERLLAADAVADETSYVILDPDAEHRRTSQAFSPGSSAMGYDDVGETQYSGEEDAEGEVDDSDYFGNGHTNGHQENGIQDEMDADLEADLEAAMQSKEFEAASTAATPMQTADTPAVKEEEDSGDESFEDDDGDEEGAGGAEEIDEDERARLANIQATREDIAELEQQISNVQEKMATVANRLLQKRMEDNIRKLKQELQLKKSSIGEGEENE